MLPKPSVYNVSKTADNFVRHWASGNHRFVLDEIKIEDRAVAMLLVAYMVERMAPNDRHSFITALEFEIGKE